MNFCLQTDLEEERLRQKVAERTAREKIRIYCLRIFLNCIVLAVLSACFYSIYRATVYSQENISNVSGMADFYKQISPGRASNGNNCRHFQGVVISLQIWCLTGEFIRMSSLNKLLL